MNYATKEDVALWLGYEMPDGSADVSQLPEDINRLIRNASRVIDEATMHRIDIYNERHKDTAMTATSAQVEYWINGIGESADINPDVSGYSANGSTFNFAGGKMQKLAPRARREIYNGGLLSRRVVRS